MNVDEQREAAGRLLALIDRFIAFEDISPAAAGEIEGLILTYFESSLEHLLVPLASYEPWGGDDHEHLYTASDLRPLLEEARAALLKVAPRDP